MVNDKKHKKKSGTKSDKPTSALLTENEPKMAVREHVENEEKYTRGKDIDYKASCDEKDYSVKGKQLKDKIRKQQEVARDAAQAAARAEMLLTEESGYLEAEGIEKTYNYRQDQLVKELDMNTASKVFSLDLPDFGPYAIDYTRNGRHLLIGGRKGHLAAFDWQNGRLHFETHVKETLRDVTWLHNETMLAAAQKKYVFIYDQTGLEVHRMKNHIAVNKMEFLPFHYLLATVGGAGYLKYHDTSTGDLVSEIRTKLGSCNTMTQNPWNAVIHLGHTNGTVTMYSPTMHTPLVKMLCHKGAVQAVAVEKGGHYMATSGLDGQLKVWDIRNYGVLQEYFTPAPATSLSISQKGLLAVGWNTHVTVWKDAFLTKQTTPYMNHLQAGSAISDVNFCPYEDVLGVGHHKGMSSIVIPGAGEANFDSMEANPYQTKKQRQESEVHSLLNKLQPDMIVLDPTEIGKVNRTTKAEMQKRQREDAAEKGGQQDGAETKDRKRMRGRNSALKRYMRKKDRKNVVDQDKMDAMDKLAQYGKEDARKDPSFTTLDIF